jgi:alkaline phosphatase D
MSHPTNPPEPIEPAPYSLDRRRFLQMAAAAGALLSLPVLTACDPDVRPLPGPATPGAFPQGVASGDPFPTSVLLWTRIEAAGRSGPVTVRWEITANDDNKPQVLVSGQAETGADRDWTVTVVASGLQPGTYYRYRFFDDSRPGGAGVSVVGRTRTAPTGSVSKLRLGVASCGSFTPGYFHAYRHLANQDLDAFIHLGDYIYEYGPREGDFRSPEPARETVTLDDYRARYRCHRNEPELQELHRLHPMISVWDDHEFTNDPFPGGAENHTPATEGQWETRRDAAVRAYSEWMPTRLDGTKIYRTFDFGSLGRLIMTDRQRRNLWPGVGDADYYLDRAQLQWLDGQLSSSPATWTILGSQTLFTSWQTNLAPFGGSWSVREQKRVVNALRPSGSDLVVVSGDVHRFEAAEIVADEGTFVAGTGRGSGGVEFTCGSITSAGLDRQPLGSQIRWADWQSRGYGVLTIEPTKVQADFWGFPDAAIRSSAFPQEFWLGGFITQKGSPRLLAATEGVT